MVSNPNRRIMLTFTTQTLLTSSAQSYRFTCVASNGNLIPNEIFKFVQIPVSTGYAVAVNTYLGICTPVDLANLPTSPIATSLYFRQNSIDITTSDPTQVENAIADVTAAVNALKAALDYTDNQSSPVAIWIGQAPTS